MQEHEVSILLSNSQSKAVNFVLEPWGEIYSMEPGALFTLCFRSPVQPHPPNTVEVDYNVDSITVYGWEGCTFSLTCNGKDVDRPPFTASRVPKIPGA